VSAPLRVLVADDHLVVREGLRLILESESGFEVAGEAADGAEAVRLAEQLAPDVVLMDLRMPGMGGLEAMTRIRASRPDAAIVVLTTFNEDDLMARALEAGARGYLLKDVTRAALLDAVRAAARGEMLLRPEVLARVLARARSTGPADPSPGGALSEREREVLEGVAQGERNKEIAQRLGISERTVKAHLASAFNKLGVDSRAGAVSVAMQRGLLRAHRSD
jgi:NarL family two-component system response regulator YdfI